MIKFTQKLNPNLFEKNVEKVSTRVGFGQGLVLAGEGDQAVVALCADLTESVHMDKFRDKFPQRFFEVGVAEQNLASVASGMSAMGKIPFIGSYAIFSPGRNWEQIRTTICYNNRAVIIVGSHSGVSVGPDGGSHQALEDISMMRSLPNMTVISPCDYLEARKATVAASESDSPVYLRLNRDKTPIITTEDTPFEIGKAQLFYGHGSDSSISLGASKADVGIIATGSLVYKALRVAQDISKSGKGSIKAKVLNISTIKPLDTEAVIKIAKSCGAIVTVEEHQIIGGLGSAVAECLSQNLPTPIEFIGVYDQFGQSGTPSELLKYYKMDESDILDAVKKVLKRKL